MKHALKNKEAIKPEACSADAISAVYNTLTASGSHPVQTPRIVNVYNDKGAHLGYVAFPTNNHPLAKAYRRHVSHRFPGVRTYIAQGMERHRRTLMPHIDGMKIDARISYGITVEQKMKSCNFVPQSFRYEKAIGLEMEGFSENQRETIEKALPHWARVANDASIRPNTAEENAAEIKAVFPRASLEPRLWRLTAKLKALGMRCNKSCGLHVHYDMRGKTHADVLKIAKRANKWLEALQELVPASRRGQNYCKFGVSTTCSDRYRAVNFCAFGKYQTLEIRLHSATFDYAKILSWIRLCELIMAIRYNPKDADCVGTLGQLPLMDYEASYWRARHKALNPSQYTNQDGSTTEQSE